MASQNIFISYSRKQFYYVESLVLCLQAYNISTWFDVQQLTVGSNWQQNIQNGLHSCAGLILIASRASLSSEYVCAEWQAALIAQKPIYVVLFEAVELPPELVNASLIDGRGIFTKKMHLLAQLILANGIHRDRFPTKRILYPSIHMSVWLFGILFPLWSCMLLSLAGMTGISIDALNDLIMVQSINASAYPSTLFAALAIIFVWLLVAGYVHFYISSFFSRRFFNFYGLAFFLLILFFSGTVAGGFSTNIVTHFLSEEVTDSLFGRYRSILYFCIALSIVGGIAAFSYYAKVVLPSSTVLRWLPTGAAGDSLRILGTKRWMKPVKTQPSNYTSSKTYKLYYDEADKGIAAEVTKALSAHGHQHRDADRVDYHILILTNKTPREWFDSLLKTASHIICVVGSSIRIPIETKEFHRLQWFDYRRRSPSRLFKRAPNPLSTLVSGLEEGYIHLESYHFPVLPETLERLVVPGSVQRFCITFRIVAALNLGTSLFLFITVWNYPLWDRVAQSVIFLLLFCISVYLFIVTNRVENRDTNRNYLTLAIFLTLLGIGISSFTSWFVSQPLADPSFLITIWLILFFSVYFFTALLGSEFRSIAEWLPFTNRQFINGKTKGFTLIPVRRSLLHSTGPYLFVALEIALMALTQFYGHVR